MLPGPAGMLWHVMGSVQQVLVLKLCGSVWWARFANPLMHATCTIESIPEEPKKMTDQGSWPRAVKEYTDAWNPSDSSRHDSKKLRGWSRRQQRRGASLFQRGLVEHHCSAPRFSTEDQPADQPHSSSQWNQVLSSVAGDCQRLSGREQNPLLVGARSWYIVQLRTLDYGTLVSTWLCQSRLVRLLEGVIHGGLKVVRAWTFRASRVEPLPQSSLPEKAGEGSIGFWYAASRDGSFSVFDKVWVPPKCCWPL